MSNGGILLGGTAVLMSGEPEVPFAFNFSSGDSNFGFSWKESSSWLWNDDSRCRLLLSFPRGISSPVNY